MNEGEGDDDGALGIEDLDDTDLDQIRGDLDDIMARRGITGDPDALLNRLVPARPAPKPAPAPTSTPAPPPAPEATAPAETPAPAPKKPDPPHRI